MAALAPSHFLCVSPDPFFFAFVFLNQSGASEPVWCFSCTPPPGSQHFSTVCPILEQFVHVAFIFFCMDFCCLAISAVSCFERDSHVCVSCAFVSIQAMMLAEVSDVPDMVRKLIRFSLGHSCLPSRAWRRNTIVQSSQVGSVSSYIIAMWSLILVIVELEVDGSVNRVVRMAWRAPSLDAMPPRCVFFLRYSYAALAVLRESTPLIRGISMNWQSALMTHSVLLSHSFFATASKGLVMWLCGLW